jgi:hypothetical protein
VADVWALLAEPYHLADWWPGYAAVRPDRRGLAVGARWTVTRTDRPGLLQRPHGEGVLVLRRVDPRSALAWSDLGQRFTATITLRAGTSAAETEASLELETPAWRVPLEGLQRAPARALARLHALCRTAESLR